MGHFVSHCAVQPHPIEYNIGARPDVEEKTDNTSAYWSSYLKPDQSIVITGDENTAPARRYDNLGEPARTRNTA